MQETYLTFVEGASSKFWKASVEGSTLTTNWGKIGTTGQSQEKVFGTDAEALAAFEKQKAEKLKKGYSEGDSANTPEAAPTSKPVAKAAEPAPTQSAPKPVSSVSKAKEVTEPRINLKPEDYAQVGWRLQTEPLTRAAAAPFNLQACLARVEGAYVAQTDTYWQWKYEKLRLKHTISREEAHFWVVVLPEIARGKSLADVKKLATQHTFDGNITADSDFYYVYDENMHSFAAEILWAAYEPEAFLTRLSNLQDWQALQILRRWEKLVFPYVTSSERDELRRATEVELSTQKEPKAWLQWLGMRLTASPEIFQKMVASWPDGSARPKYFSSYHSNHSLNAIVGLADPELIAKEAHRTQAIPLNAEDSRLLLAATDFHCLDLIAESICTMTAKADAEKLTKMLMLAEGPETAIILADIYVSSKVPSLARDWWEKFPTFAIQGLAPLCAEKSKRGEAAVDWLNGFKKREGAVRIEAALEGLPEPVVQAVREKVLSVAEEELGEPLTDEEAPEWVKAVFGGELTVPDAAADENPPRKLNIHEADRPAPLQPLGLPQPLPPAPPFDLDRCLGQLLPLFTGQYWALAKNPTQLPMSKEEAHFWLEAVTLIGERQWNQTIQPAALEAALRKVQFGKDIQQKRLIKHIYPLSLIPAWVLFGADGVLSKFIQENYIKTFGKAILPHITIAEREELSAKLPQVIQQILKQAGQHNPHYYLLGALILMEQLRFSPEQFEAVLAPINDPVLANYWYSGQYLPYVVRLPSVDSILRVASNLKLWPQDEAGARKWLAVTGWEGVPTLLRYMENSYYDKGEAAKIFSLVESPDVALHMAALRKYPSSKLIARSWLDRFPAFTIDGLAPLLRETDKKEVALATDYLRELKRKGYEWLIQKKLGNFPEPVQNALQSKVLDYDPKAERKVINSDTALAALLPPVRVRIHAGLRYLSPEQMAMLVAELRQSPLSEPSPTLELVRQNADKLSLDRFAIALFEDWIQEGAPSKERWKMEALGHLGGDAVALKLTPLVRAWPGESQHQRAVLGLDVLRAIGTDTALMQINGIAQKISFKGIKERAKESMEAIAADRGFSPEELSDRIIPDGGLDERGSRVFDFGPRQFTFALGPDLKPALKDETGKRLSDLPKSNSKDDATKAAEAVAAWKLLKKQVSEVAKTQAARLEQAMVIGRRWTPEEFQQLLVEHPLMGLLVQRLIWAAYDEAGKPLGMFRVADDRTLADESDDLWAIPDNAKSIGIVHPSHLTSGQQGKWGEVLSDYDIIAPFVQLGRPTFTLTDAEIKQPFLSRFADVKVDPKTLVFGLDALGWIRGTPQDGGGFCCHHKVFGSAIAVVAYEDGVWAGDNGDSWEPQKVTGVGFISDKRQAEDGFFSFEYKDSSRIPLTNIDPVVLSEVIYDVTRLVEKGRKA